MKTFLFTYKKNGSDVNKCLLRKEKIKCFKLSSLDILGLYGKIGVGLVQAY